MRGLGIKCFKLGLRAFKAGALCAAAFPQVAQAGLELHLSESVDDSVRIALVHTGPGADCVPASGPLFDRQLNIRKVSERVYAQPLDSEVGGEHHYLKAARMGGGVYMHLPYFVPVAGCKDAAFELKAKHILWDGKWYPGSLQLTAAAARDKSVFFTNEASPELAGANYFDTSIPAPVRARLTSAFGRITGFYEKVLKADPMDGVAGVVAIVRNGRNYKGFGGDALNIIRISYDNPTREDLETIDQVFPSTFAHELAHKLQSARLFEQPLARQIVEGSADFLKIVVLRSSGLIDEAEARRQILKAAADCAAFADARTLAQKVAQGSVQFREPYDCGMVYYFVAYYTSGLDGAAFFARLRKAWTGEKKYGDEDTLCLLVEPNCRNARLNGVIGNRGDYLQQLAWLETQLASRPVPVLP
jgi:hypothetical protein